MIECDCGVDDTYGDSSSFCKVKEVKAKKEHTCRECKEKIQKGDTYEYTTGVWDGDFDTIKTCMRCVGVRDTLCKSGYYYGEVREQIYEACGIDYITGEMAKWLLEDFAKEHKEGKYLPVDIVKTLTTKGFI